jgi:very-short-patch-repair endonuclease
MQHLCELPLKRRHAINVARLKKSATPAEVRFKDFLATLGVPYRFQQGFYAPFYRIVDFYLPDQNIAIEIDGACHDPEKDSRRDEWFSRERGITVLRFTNKQILSGAFRLPCTIGVR